MRPSPGLALYLAVTSRMAGGADRAGELPQAPGAPPIVWLHAPRSEALRPLCALAVRLDRERPGTGMVLTHPPDAPPCPESLPAGCHAVSAPVDTPARIRAALRRWAPGALVLGAGPLAPAMIHEADAAGVRMIMVDARVPAVDTVWPIWRGLHRTLLRRMHRILLCDAAGRRAFRRAGAPEEVLEEVGALAVGAGAMEVNAAERDALAQLISVRPVWLAVAVPEAEEAAVLHAQRQAQRMAHRLLLILVPADPARGEAIAAAAQAMGMNVARRSAEEEPHNEHQLYIADTEGELGLWYRLAPITFMGGTLRLDDAQAGAIKGPESADDDGRDPLEPAALGSAVIHGPRTAAWEATYRAFARMRGAWRVSNGAGLAEAVIALLAPDRAAVLARAGWSVATQGAEATDRAVELVIEALDGPEGSHD